MSLRARHRHRGAGHATTRGSATGRGLGLLTDAAVRARRRAGRLGRAERRRRPPRTRSSTSVARAVIPGFVDSHAHLVFAGDRAAEFAARMDGPPVLGRRDSRHRRRHPGGDRRGARGQPGPAARRDAPAGHDDRRGEERLRADRRTTRRASLAIARRFTPETTFLGAHVVPHGVRRRPRRLRRPGHRPDARGVRAVREVDRRLLRAGRLRRRPGPRDPDRRVAAAARRPAPRQPARPRPGVQLAC